jgi:hypothetical protein
MSGEILYQIGLVALAVAVATTIVFIIVSRISKVRLEARFISEYGVKRRK